MSVNKTYYVQAQLLQETLNYLASRPYAEVSELVSKILTMAKAQETPVAPSEQSTEPQILEGEIVND